MKEVILLRYGEIYLKGKNRGFFENVLFQNLQNALKNLPCKVSRGTGRYIVSDFNDTDKNSIIQKCQKVFGFVSLSVAKEIETNEDNIKTAITDMLTEFNENNANKAITFKVKTKRADKNFPIHSDEFSAQLGGDILEKFSNFTVKLKEPDIEVNVDIRENGKTYIFCNKIDCSGGMPIGTGGTGLLMLSGGIDSPVAGYMMAKRGLKISALHFHSYPYTSIQAKDKVVELAKLLTEYTGGNIEVFLVPFTKIQEAIHQNCDDAYMINIMRRIMFRIGEIICGRQHIQTIITGENLGQVASQTIESLTNTNSVMKTIPVMRPLIAYDKIDIIKLAKQIGTFNTSILPYEDCCTVFLPDNPVIKPTIKNSLKQEANLNIDALIEEAIRDIEIIKIKNN